MVCFGECLNMPCFLNDAADIALLARPVCVYGQWILSAGSTSELSPVDPEALPRMLRCYLVLLILTTIVMLFEHLVEGVVDVPAFAISAAQLLCASGALAVLNAPSRWRQTPGLARRRNLLLAFFVHSSNVCLIVDVVFSAVCVVGGHTENIVSVDLAVKVALFLFVTSLPFFALDRELAVGRSELTFVWKIWTIEAVDFCTILYGAIDYAQSERAEAVAERDVWNREHTDAAAPSDSGDAADDWEWDDFWLDWSPALQVYVLAFALNAVLFGCLASWVLVRGVTKHELEDIVQRSGYMFIATFVFFLDALTDLPVWLASLVTRAYVHNIYLTFNVIVNLLALVRGVYICLVACLMPPGSLKDERGTPRAASLDDHDGTQLTLYGAAQSNGSYGRLPRRATSESNVPPLLEAPKSGRASR